MTDTKRDLLIHYDEAGGELVFHSIPTDAAAELRAASFDGVRPEVAFFQGLPPDEAERELGRLAFSLIDLNSLRKIGIRDYKAPADAAHVEYVAHLEERASAGDDDARFHLALEMHSSSLKNYSLADLNRAESLLMSAVASGHKEATHTAESWPMLRAAAERRIFSDKPV